VTMPQWRIMLVGGTIGVFALIIFLLADALRKTEADLGYRLTMEKRKVETHERTIERLEKEIRTEEELLTFLGWGLPQPLRQEAKAKPVDRVIENSLKQTVTAKPPKRITQSLTQSAEVKPVDQTCTQSLTQTCTAEKVV